MAVKAPALLTAEEVAERLRLNIATVYRMVDRGDLVGFRLGSDPRARVRIHAEALEALETRQTPRAEKEDA